MTEKTITLPGVTDDEHRTLNLLLERLDKKRKRNELRQAFYDMRHFVNLVGSVIPPQYYKLGIVLGWSGKAVDILARRCNLDGFVWPDGDLESLGYSDVWEDNNLGSEVSQALVSSLIHATSFIVNTQGAAGEPPALIHFKDALNATGEWNTRARRLDNLLSITSRDEDGEIDGLALYLNDLTITATREGGKWIATPQEHAYGVPAEPLPYKPRLGRPFGSSRISRAVMSLQDQATRTVIRLEAHSDIYAIPDLWMLGANEAIFKNADGSTKAAWQVMMGRFKAVPDDNEQPDPTLARVDVKRFDAASPQPHLDALKQQAMLFSGETSIPLTSLGVSDMSNPTSADSYIASREDLIAEAEGSTDDWSPYLRRAMVRGLAMKNGDKAVPAAWRTIDAKWRSPIYLSRAQQADAGMKVLTADPSLTGTDVGYELLGLDEQQIKRVKAEKRRSAGSRTLGQIAADLANPANPAANGNPGA